MDGGRFLFMPAGFLAASLVWSATAAAQVEITQEAPKAPLQQSKMLVCGMAALFGMD